MSEKIKEELDTDIEAGELIKTVDTDYPNFHITMHVFWCSIVSGELKLLEHEAAKWVELDDKRPEAVDWLPADLSLLDKLSAGPEAALQNEHIRAGRGRGDRGAQTRGAGADDQQFNLSHWIFPFPSCV